jgi:AraC family transcriptional activator of pobA
VDPHQDLNHLNSSGLKSKADILKFPLSPLAKAGMIVRNMAHASEVSEHNTTRPHRDDHFLLMFATGGDLVINIDFENNVITAPAVVLIFPEQVHHIVSANHPLGWVTSIDPVLMDEECLLIFEKGFHRPLSLYTHSAFYVHALTLLEQMEKIQDLDANPFHVRANHSILDAFLGLLAGEISKVNTIGKTTAKRAAIIEQAFIQMLKMHYKEWKQPAKYAAELNISVAHLYDTIKSSTGDSVSQYIQQYCMLEAKRLLCFTKFTVKEIAYQLGYEEPVYFGKLFKKVTGFTPLQFRQQYRD